MSAARVCHGIRFPVRMWTRPCPFLMATGYVVLTSLCGLSITFTPACRISRIIRKQVGRGLRATLKLFLLSSSYRAHRGYGKVLTGAFGNAIKPISDLFFGVLSNSTLCKVMGEQCRRKRLEVLHRIPNIRA
jgi:hypothetical protein